MWVRMWVVRSLATSEKHFLQISHWYGFSPVWVRMCLVRCLTSENLFWQISHW